MDKTNVLFVAPIMGNGGIQSWAKKYLAKFPNSKYSLIHVNVGTRRSTLKNEYGYRRVLDGLIDLYNDIKKIKRALQKSDIKIVHATTSGSIGTLRDYIIARICVNRGIKCILHCHYGCISQDINKSGLNGKLLKMTLDLYDQIWVLDTKSEAALNQFPNLQGKIFVTPNSIDVPSECDLRPKKYNTIGFVGNLIKTKGLFDLVKAVKQIDNGTNLYIIGPGREIVVNELIQLIGDDLNKKIHLLGKLPNDEAVERISKIDIIALPTYFPAEAFPISILEAMSRGKLVISTDRAAIPDMLTDLEGNKCGVIVKERCVDDIIRAILWCYDNKGEADTMCINAYNKVRACYDSSVVFNLYEQLYTKLLNE